MRIVYTCSYAYPSISGVWNRIENLAKEMIKRGHEVHILTSNIIAGTDKIAKSYEEYEKIHIHRFEPKRQLTKYQFSFRKKDLWKKLDEIKPDLIDAQTYRHPEAKIVLSYARKKNIPCTLTTHAPFLPVEVRGKKLSFLANVYDILIGKRILKQYDKIFRISDWELKYLLALGADKNKIIYSPNGVPDKFYKTKTKRVKNEDLLFLGRIEPRKQVHILIKAFIKIASKYPKSRLLLVGPVENIPGYREYMEELIKKANLEKRILFLGPVYDLKKKINLINDSRVYVLPSTWEGFPQSLIEAMSLEKCIIASDCDGNKEVIKDGKTGFLFKIGNTNELAEKLEFCLKNNTEKVEKDAKKASLKFTWEIIADGVEKTYKELLKE